jgi:hypothetical protein
LFESDPPWHAQLDLCPERGGAPQMKSRTDPFSPLAHSAEAPVSNSSRLQVPRTDPAAVVAYGDSKFRGSILDLRFDNLRLGMPARIDNRFTPDAVNLVQQSRVEFFLGPENDHPETGCGGQA